MGATHGLLLRPGMCVGLLGGSFDPPHLGHLHLSREALKRFGLNRVIWLVSPGNPLKPDAPASIEKRMQVAREMVDHPSILVSDVERRLGTRFTADTIAALQRQWPGVRFVWLMGADNLAQFHLWKDWQKIMRRVPVGVLARPKIRLAARGSFAARVFAQQRLPSRASHLLGAADPPKWCFANIPMKAHSSTIIRASGEWSK